ncbi:MAG: GH1 family beta-glucosidase [Steroidobacterales bacterium]
MLGAGLLGLSMPPARATSTPAAQAGAMQFPPGFLWGAATAAYQIEGAWNVDDKGPSIWDRFAHTPGKIEDAGTGDVACDSYHRYRDDISLLKELELGSYRFSIAWPRIQADGRGSANLKGLDYYQRLTDALLEAGIRPLATLYHWDLPQALEDAGGWPNRDTAGYFGDYAALVARALGDRIRHWLIFNEPKTFTGVGYWQGRHAPGRKDPLAFLRATHTVNLAQGHALRALKAFDVELQAGTAFDVSPMYAATPSAADRAAAERWHRFQNLWFVEPALHGRYPADVLDPARQADLLGWRDGDEAVMRAPLDFAGINYYSPFLVSDAPQGNGVPGLNTQAQWAKGPGQNPRTDIGWDIYPQGFHEILVRMSQALGALPIEVTENGASYNNAPDADGRVRDAARIDYLRAHLQALHRAIADGVPVRAYHCWSLIDNFEWARGYTQRFGLVYVDFLRGQLRTVKDSGRWFAGVASANAL